MERYFSMDVLVDILKRLPPSSRRRARLVCRHWRDLVDGGTTEMQSRSKPLIWDTSSAEAYVLDNISAVPKHTFERMADPANNFREGMQLVGTCNGLLCLCSNNKPVGVITVVNPATEEKLRVPPLRGAGVFVGSRRRPVGWDKAYSFGYHPRTGRYKIVHVPCIYHRVCEFDKLHVLTLGEAAAWREVRAVPRGARCNLDAGVVSIDGATHWFTRGDPVRIMSFDLEDERVTSSTQLPTLPAERDRYHLTEVQGRLGIAIWDGSVKTEVWVLDEEVEEEETWIRRYVLRQDIPRPRFAYGRDVMTRKSLSFHVHRGSGWRWSPGESRVAHIHERDRGWPAIKMIGELCCYRTFAYVETTEPLDVFRPKQLTEN